MTQFRKHYAANRKRLAQMRAAKERKRIERATAEPVFADVPPMNLPRLRPSGFRITVECLDDGERASFTSARGPHGLLISPTLAGRKVATVLANYAAAP